MGTLLLSHRGMGRKGCTSHGKGDFGERGEVGWSTGAQVGASGLELSLCVLGV